MFVVHKPTRTFFENLRMTFSHFSMQGLDTLAAANLVALKIKVSEFAIVILNSSSTSGVGLLCWDELALPPVY